MRTKSFSAMTCSIAGALEAIGDRWAILLLRDLAMGLTRYDDLQASTGMPTTTLAGRLKHLEATGLIEKRPYQERPPRFEYVLTPKGRDLWKVTTALREWGDRWDASGLGAPTVELIDGESGRQIELALVDVETGAVVPRSRARLRPGPGADDLVRARFAKHLSQQRSPA
ncbi:helix-turn-helix domain-containing protein [Phenylobacterium sp. Root700]|uniref:winged helix-turn-helix transcriptional regulator n=1 Tax=Phenylobacterium sp. Root700 TaxID=1736591 RepID=UPI0006F7235F|nr:helix-turn-helix domain-containing protein [Phenylobacterium sp. Root700]KRB41579.1 MarR family transcriptional regulator [Phenylobacterium sp. Root700]